MKKVTLIIVLTISPYLFCQESTSHSSWNPLSYLYGKQETLKTKPMKVFLEQDNLAAHDLLSQFSVALKIWEQRMIEQAKRMEQFAKAVEKELKEVHGNDFKAIEIPDNGSWKCRKAHIGSKQITYECLQEENNQLRRLNFSIPQQQN